MMKSLASNFTFGDSSTITSFTELRQHPKGPNAEYYVGSINDESYLEYDELDSRFDDEEEDKENSKREESSCASRSESESSSSSSKSKPYDKFWATLSVHAASAAMTTVVANGAKSDMKMAEVAANAAAKSLLEDGYEMERINALRLKQNQSAAKSGGRSIKRKPLLKITNATVQNAASKSSISVLQTGAGQDVAAAVASAIIKEGRGLLKKQKANNNNGRSINSSRTKETSPSSSGDSSSSSRSYTPNGSASMCSSKVSVSTEKTSNTFFEKRDAGENASRRGSISSTSSRSSSKSSTRSRKLLECIPQDVLQINRPQQQRQGGDAATMKSLQSISSSKFSTKGRGGDKYTTGMDSALSPRSAVLEAARAAASNNEIDIHNSPQVISAIKAAVESMQSKDLSSNQQQHIVAPTDDAIEDTYDDYTISTKSRHISASGSVQEQPQPSALTTQMSNESYLKLLASQSGGESSAASTIENHRGVVTVGTTDLPHGQLESEEMERKEANLRAAMEMLQQKLNELESCAEENPEIIQQRQDPSHELAHPSPGHQHLQVHPSEQLHQLSTIANPTMHSIHKNSSSATHYPPMPPMDSMTADTGHHGYGTSVRSGSTVQSQSVTDQHGQYSAFGDDNSASEIHGGYSAPHSSSSSSDGYVKSSSGAAARSVLKKPSKCFPIMELDSNLLEDFQEEWDEDGTLFMSVGECRIHSMKSTDAGDGSVVVMPASRFASSDDNNTKNGDANEEEEGAIEVVLVPPVDATQSPLSPSAKLKRKFQEFFGRSKKVTFDMNIDAACDEEELDNSSGGDEVGCDGMNTEKKGDEPPVAGEAQVSDTAIDNATTNDAASPTPSAAKCSSNSKPDKNSRRMRIRDAILKRLRKGLLFKSRKKKSKKEKNAASNGEKGLSVPDESKAGAAATKATVGVDPTAAPTSLPAETASVPVDKNAPQAAPKSRKIDDSQSTSSENAVRGHSKGTPSAPHQSSESTTEAGTQEKSMESEEVTSSDASVTSYGSSSYNTNSSIQNPSRMVMRNDTDSLNSFLNLDPFATLKQMGYETSHNKTANDYEDDGNPDDTTNSLDSHEQRSIYIQDIINTLPSYTSSNEMTEEGWVETVLSRFATGELLQGKALRDEETKSSASSKKSLARYNFV